jgi:hypothetical protein
MSQSDIATLVTVFEYFDCDLNPGAVSHCDLHLWDCDLHLWDCDLHPDIAIYTLWDCDFNQLRSILSAL